MELINQTRLLGLKADFRISISSSWREEFRLQQRSRLTGFRWKRKCKKIDSAEGVTESKFDPTRQLTISHRNTNGQDCSVTRFVEISPLWEILVWHLANIFTCFGKFLYLSATGQIFNDTNVKRLQNNIAIWSHWTGGPPTSTNAIESNWGENSL